MGLTRKQACERLGLDKQFTEKQLKKAYYSLSLKYHPDKNPDGSEIFKEINEAYTFLNETEQDDSCETMSYDYNSLLKEYMEHLFDVDIDTFRFVQDSIHKTYDFSVETIQRFDKTIRQFINHSIDKNGKKTSYTLKPDLKNVLNKEVYVLNVDDVPYFIPLWQSELEYHDFVVEIIPTMDEHIHIDDDNNIVIQLTYSLDELFPNKKKTVHITDEHTCEINVDQLLLKEEQDYVVHGKGIPKYTDDDDDLYEIKECSDLILKIKMYCKTSDMSS